MSFSAALIIIAPLSFLIGFALQRGQVCSVLAAKQIIETGKFSRLLAFVYAGSWALVTAVPLAWIFPETFHMTPGFTPGLLTILAGFGYGLGAFINGACLFGICSRAVSGSLHFLAAAPGLAVGATLANALGLPALLGEPHQSILATPTAGSFTLLGLGILVAIYAGVQLVLSHRRAGLGLGEVLKAARWRSSLALLTVGFAGGILFSTGQGWSFPVLMRQGANTLMTGASAFTPAAVVGSIALFLGASISLYLGGRFSFHRPAMGDTLRSLIGGIIMGFSASLIPGGNDAMLLAAIPSLAVQGIIAYVAMFATLIGLTALAKHWSTRHAERKLSELGRT